MKGKMLNLLILRDMITVILLSGLAPICGDQLSSPTSPTPWRWLRQHRQQPAEVQPQARSGKDR
ncbi:MAG: hypothetical protein PHD13_06245 [Methanocellales archaeon]|nr:hypothetical protein [Methanocellales archaeon]MDD3292176.1 hypothetical protein [Methanocellales archaeon]MDD5235757.1 hypothetical protein [Methanocellales archaeon]MDD5485822.1 hypothetical protein [Methanocellales archaeon]